MSLSCFAMFNSKVKSAKLAWASAQIHCQCSVSDSRVNMTDSGLTISGSRQSIADLKVSASQTSFAPFQGDKIYIRSLQVPGSLFFMFLFLLIK